MKIHNLKLGVLLLNIVLFSFFVQTGFAQSKLKINVQEGAVMDYQYTIVNWAGITEVTIQVFTEEGVKNVTISEGSIMRYEVTSVSDNQAMGIKIYMNNVRSEGTVGGFIIPVTDDLAYWENDNPQDPKHISGYTSSVENNAVVYNRTYSGSDGTQIDIDTYDAHNGWLLSRYNFLSTSDGGPHGEFPPNSSVEFELKAIGITGGGLLYFEFLVPGFLSFLFLTRVIKRDRSNKFP